MRKYSKRLYTPEQRAWCEEYERETSFEPVMGDFEAGLQTFAEAKDWNLRWLVAWAKETAQRLTRIGP